MQNVVPLQQSLQSVPQLGSPRSTAWILCLACAVLFLPLWATPASAGTICGDGNVDAGEECDDGNMIDDDVCANDCTLNPCIDNDVDGFGAPGSPACPAGDAEDCDDENAAVFPGAVETCNTVDDNCDSQTDEGFDVGMACGVGACAGGVLECLAGGSGTNCSTESGGSNDQTGPEVCDGLDNDCNGLDDVLGFDGSETDDDGDGLAECEDDCDDADPENFSGNPEICDGQDNNCDSAADEGFDVGLACDGAGECGAGLIECNGSGASVCSADPGGSADSSAPETCDGLDNDCDSETDEGFDVGTACGEGACSGGVRECTTDAAATQCSTEAGGSNDQSGPEVCDGIDNDCNGLDDVLGFDGSETDDDGDGLAECENDCDDADPENFSGNPEICDGQDNDCNGLDDVLGFDGSETDDDGDGLAECEDDCDDADPENFSGNVEICDGQDNDCDESIDEMFFVGAGCIPPGECGEGVFECDAAGGVICSTAFGGSADGTSSETCDGLDNDCDSATDEGFDVGQACMGAGVCGPGVLECSDAGGLQCSTEPGGSADGSQPEICDDLDNDCDGETDQGFDLGSACGEGACSGGIRECTADATASQCSTEAGGSNDQSGPEVCDGIDNDCNGKDDVLGFAGSETDDDEDGFAECEDDCDDADPDNFSGNAEVCDGQDNNCDTLADEGFDVGLACDGVGECGAGLVECDGSGASVCSADPGGSLDGSSSETCDGLDNDCDGATDEDFAVGGTCTGVGACGEGVLECNDAGYGVVCSSDPGGSTDGSAEETCDSLDNDCDGSTDEDFDLGLACEGLGECGAGVIECDGAGAFVCSTDQGGSADGSVPEACDGLDNDCDGSTDEEFLVGLSCNGLGECGAGVIECDGPDASVCSANPGGSADGSAPETCDSFDNDCDGETDEDFGVGETCTGVGACGEGVFECNPAGDGAVCSADPGGSTDGSAAETCDSLDNDCDGETDEDFTLGEVCGVGACSGGSLECRADGTGTQCSTEPGGSTDAAGPESCDAVDNDCDGDTDEEFSLGEACGLGVCAGGAVECNESGSGTQCSTEPGGSDDQTGPEVCDGLDNDCNGLDDFLGFAGSETDDDGDGVSECDADCDDTDAQIFTGNVELCDGLDNDCNGAVDEGDPEVGAICGTTDEGGCSLGVGECRSGVFVCVGKVDPTPEVCDDVDNDCDGATDEGIPLPALVDEDFAGPSPFQLWIGTGPDNALTGLNRFEILDVDGDPALGSPTPFLNIHAHYVTAESAEWSDYSYTGRMKQTDPGGGVGVTVLSDYPDSDHYYRLRRYPQEPTFKMSAHGTALTCDTDDTGVNPRDGAWYLFEMKVEADAVETRVHAKIWRDGDPYPVDWQVNCADSSATRRTQGTIGAWSMGSGVKYWDDLSARLPEDTDTACGISDLGECSFGNRQCLGGTSVCSGASFPQAETCDSLDNDCDGSTDEAGADPGEEIWQSDFLEAGDPPGWFDTGSNSSLNEDDNFQVVDVGGELVFGTTSTDVNIHSHYTAPGSENWSDYSYRGRLQLTDPAGGIGVTVLSAYPDSDDYYRLRRLPGVSNLALNAHGTTLTCDVDDTGVDPGDGAWYWFEIQVESVFGAVQAKAWREGSPEPASWQQQCVDQTASLRTAGRVGVWSMAAGAKYWDDLVVISNGETPGGGGHCGVSDVGACQFGLEQCEGGQLVCLSQVDPVGEVCDGLDNDCDGTVDEPDAADSQTWYVDVDGDGFGVAGLTLQACDQPEGYAPDDTDCDDANAAVFPGNDEFCDGIDNDCDPLTTDEDAVDAPFWYADVDGDGFGDAGQEVQSCDQPADFIEDATDCDDAAQDVFPGQTEACDGIDNDCSGAADEGLIETGEPCNVGVGACEATGNYVCTGDVAGACDALPGDPSTDVCDFLDNDCDGLTDEGVDGEDANNNGCNDACDPLPADVTLEGAILNKQAQGQYIEVLLDLGPTFGATDLAPGSLLDLFVDGSPGIPETARETDEFGRIKVKFPRQAVQDVVPLGNVGLTIVGQSAFGCEIVAQANLQVVDEGLAHTNETDYASVLDNALRGDVANLSLGPDGDLGEVVCLINFLTDYKVIVNNHPGVPAEGQVYFYLLRYCDGTATCSYGETTAGNERLPSIGGCP